MNIKMLCGIISATSAFAVAVLQAVDSEKK